jgi:hypothetical protein
MTTTTVESTVLRRLVVDRARDAASRAVRQALQALVPTIVVIAGGTAITGLDLTSVLEIAGVTAFVSVCKSAANLTLPAGAPVSYQIAERAVVAAGGAAAGLGAAGLDGASIAWQGLLTASLGSAALAAVMFFTNPPVIKGEVIQSHPADPATGVTFTNADGKAWNSGVADWRGAQSVDVTPTGPDATEGEAPDANRGTDPTAGPRLLS